VALVSVNSEHLSNVDLNPNPRVGGRVPAPLPKFLIRNSLVLKVAAHI